MLFAGAQQPWAATIKELSVEVGLGDKPSAFIQWEGYWCKTSSQRSEEEEQRWEEGEGSVVIQSQQLV